MKNIRHIITLTGFIFCCPGLRSQVVEVGENKFYLDPSVIAKNHFKVIELEAEEFYFRLRKKEKNAERRNDHRYRLRFFMDTEGYPDSVHYLPGNPKESQQWVKTGLGTYYEFLADSLRRTSLTETTYNPRHLVTQYQFTKNDLHDNTNPKVYVTKYAYFDNNKISTLELEFRNSTPSKTVSSARYQFSYMQTIQQVDNYSDGGEPKSTLFCFLNQEIIKRIVVIDNRNNDVSCRITLRYQE